MGLIPKSEFLNYDLTSSDPRFIRIAEDLLKELGIRNYKLTQKLDYMVMLLANLKLRYPLKQGSIIPRKKEFYAKIVKRYKKDFQSARNTIEILDALEGAGYVESNESIKQEQTTEYFATKKLLSLLTPVTLSMIKTDRPKSNIILRQDVGKTKIEIDFTDTSYTNKVTKEMDIYSDLREKCNIGLKNVPKEIIRKHSDLLYQISTDDIKKLKYTNGKADIRLRNSYLVRIFNNDFNHGGRFYRGTESVMPKKLRMHLSINGNKTVELDFSGMHVRMLYHLKGINYYGDPYMVSPKLDDNMRKIYKLVGLVSINAANIEKAIDSLQNEISSRDLLKYLPDNTDATRKKLCERFLKHNKRIEDRLFTGAGLELQKIDSDIAHDTMVEMAQNGILVLCVHDSFIAEEKFKKELWKKMEKNYHHKLHFYPKIK